MLASQLLQIFPEAKNTPVGLDALVGALNVIFTKLGALPNRCAAFLAQTGYESAAFCALSENLNYSAETLVKIFPKYFPDVESTTSYAHNPQAIGNKIYANRMGNGNEASGDGYFYRGRGFIECTGRGNYTACGAYTGLDLLNFPELLSNMPGAVDSAYWFWDTRGLNKFADADDIKSITRIINGGYLGLADRTAKYNLAKQVIT